MKTTAQDLTKRINASLETIATETDAMKQSEAFREWLRQCAKFYNYSIGNQMLIQWQFPNAGHVAGFNRWLKLRRYVRKGSRGIQILAPCIYADKDDATKRRVFYKIAYVFDESQTDGEPLIQLDWKSPERVEELEARLTDYIKSFGVKVSRVDHLPGSVQGSYSRHGNKIEILETAGTKTLIHEIAHAMLHKDTNQELTREERETEAEAVAFVVCDHFGITTKSPAYLATWSSAELIKAHAERIRQAAKNIIIAVEQEQEQEQVQ